MTKVTLASNSKGLKQIELFPQGTDDSMNLRCESLMITVDYKYKEIAFLDVKLWLKDDY